MVELQKGARVVPYYEYGGDTMAYTISSDCISCGVCVDDCPVDAITPGDAQYVITDDCIDCGACVPSCPVDAISE